MSVAMREKLEEILSRPDVIAVNNGDADSPQSVDVKIHKENRIAILSAFEWAEALKKAKPKTDEDRQLVAELKQGLANAGDPYKLANCEVGILAYQALAVLDMAEVKPVNAGAA